MLYKKQFVSVSTHKCAQTHFLTVVLDTCMLQFEMTQLYMTATMFVQTK